MQSLPIGEQEFVNLHQRNYIHVDKTELIAQVMNAGRFLFLSRPRRFGKSLLITTLAEIYRGNRELFQGLWIEEQIEWQPHPVIVIDFNSVDFQNRPLGEALVIYLDQIAAQNRFILQGRYYKEKLQELIVRLNAQHVERGHPPHQVVLLVEEFDKPLTDLPDDSPLRQDLIATLRNFYAVLKAAESVHLHFTLLTGPFLHGTGVVFPELNNFLDVTVDSHFTPLSYFTEAEIEAHFAAYSRPWSWRIS